MAQSSPKSAVKVIFGAMTIGAKGAEQARVHTLEETTEILDVFQRYGHNEIDTARVYGGGSSEEFLGALDWQKRGIVLATKLSPRAKIGLPEGQPTTHRAEHIQLGVQKSYEALKTDKVDLWYLHAPDHTTPFEITLEEVNKQHKAGKFNRFGISNYSAADVEKLCEIADKNGWIKPSVYQGVYNAIHRAVEPELFPVLRKHDISFYAYNPIAGGLLTARYHRHTQEHESGSRFDPGRNQGKNYRDRYWRDEYFDALDIIREAIKAHPGLTEVETALRWISHHSKLDAQHGDGIIIGASSVKQLKENLENLEKGPLPVDVLKALDQAWETVKPVCNSYAR